MDRIARNLSRRAVVGGALVLPSLARAADLAAPALALKALEQRSGARIGVAALDTGNGHGVFWREAERFVFCSTFKLSLAAATLAKVDAGHERLDRQVHIGADVPLGASRETSKHVGHGMTIAALCEAAVLYSDNGAANLLLTALGGPAALTQFWRGIGDATSRLDDFEVKLNTPDGARNTTTPTAMMANLKEVLLGNVLSNVSRGRLMGWMHAVTTGAGRLHAGLPADWWWGDKTGTGADQYGLVDDIGIATPPGRKPVLMVCYTSGATEKVVAEVGKILADAFA
jgi:beta-lactamase class A